MFNFAVLPDVSGEDAYWGMKRRAQEEREAEAAKGEWPGTWLFLALALGGYMAAGAANAINMVIDRLGKSPAPCALAPGTSSWTGRLVATAAPPADLRNSLRFMRTSLWTVPRIY